MHACYMGGTGTGKSHLAQMHARYCRTHHGMETLVFDPGYTETCKTKAEFRAKSELIERWDNPAFITGDKEEFAKVVMESENCAVFIDESVEFFDKGHFIPGVAIITRGRHMGHKVGCIGQHYFALPPAVRNNMSSYHCFRVGYKIASEVAKDAGDPLFKQAPSLKNRNCIIKVGDNDAYKFNCETGAF